MRAKSDRTSLLLGGLRRVPFAAATWTGGRADPVLPLCPMHPLLAQLDEALLAERDHEERELERLSALPLEVRIAHGVAWPLVRVREVRGRGRRGVIVVVPAGHEVLHAGLGPGSAVWVRSGGRALEGRIGPVEHDSAEVTVASPPGPGAIVEVMRRPDPLSWQRLRDALTRGEAVNRPLTRALLGSPDPGAVRLPPAQVPESAALHPAQRRAATMALETAYLAAIHGPPGTGKTTVLVHLCAALIAARDRPWAVAASNAAVDHLTQRAADFGIDVVRVGPPARLRGPIRALTLEARIARGPYAKLLERVEQRLALADGYERADLHDERTALREQAEAHALETAQLITTTLGALPHRADGLPPPHTVLVDEATQAMEPAVWSVVPFAERIVLVGDPHQLGPVTHVPGSPLERSLLQRLLDEQRIVLPMLDVQHRMNNNIRRLVASVYGPAYTDAVEVADHRLVDLPHVAPGGLAECTALWVDTAGAGFADELDEVTRSSRNPGEAEVVAKVVERVRATGVWARQVGVIAPYAAQVVWLRAMPALQGIRVATVDSFQGQEREVIVISWTRSNADGEVGFVADARRLTVALTRARRLLVCVGDSQTLGRVPRFAEVFALMADRGAVLRAHDL